MKYFNEKYNHDNTIIIIIIIVIRAPHNRMDGAS